MISTELFNCDQQKAARHISNATHFTYKFSTKVAQQQQRTVSHIMQAFIATFDDQGVERLVKFAGILPMMTIPAPFSPFGGAKCQKNAKKPFFEEPLVCRVYVDKDEN
ncbi:uncharacterized protein PHALS_15080 [Plasmopara halstedii]|uniref:Uncharacterized protein n=1 Tax=Plasmopara halstedii TaxID=4781 RepID=A0A0P1AZM8_PLAHL|nr:uncharacterized protein PHALS_15080 [Plasmopara halstedii]CEG47839.1 hypothetical protein PHALS_15080 [Plasmopara halstedii]|eukprot:XP_024584208.1 hypothetical protein PHALS_15080 [Plasmopara halstedii]